MVKCFNWVLRLVLFYGICFGFTDLYVDIGRRRIKSYKLIKIFVHFQNIFYGISTIWFVILKWDYELLVFGYEYLVMWYTYLVTSTCRLILIALVTWFRIKGNEIFKEWFDIFCMLQTQYFNKVQHAAVDRSTKKILLINVVIINLYSLITLTDTIITWTEGNWINTMTRLSESFSNILQLYVLLHHGFLLCYIDNCLSKLNKQLQCGEIDNTFVYIYFQLSRVLQQANVLYGPPIFSVLFCIVLLNSMAGLTIMQLTKLYGFNELMILYLVGNGVLFVLISTFLYFVICDRLRKTVRETKRIILECSTTKAENQEVNMLFQQCLVLPLNINICRMFDLDLNSFFNLLVGVFLNAIVLFQIEFGSDMKYHAFTDYEFTELSFSDFNELFYDN